MAYSETFKSLQEILVSGDVQRLRQFEDESGEFVDDAKIEREQLLKICRLFALAKLGKDNQRLAFEQIAAELVIDSEEIDAWLVEGIVNKIIDAKISHEAGEVEFYRLPDNWNAYYTKLLEMAGEG